MPVDCVYVNALQPVVFAHELQHSPAEPAWMDVRLKLKQSLPVFSSHRTCLGVHRVAIRVECAVPPWARVPPTEQARKQNAMENRSAIILSSAE